MCNSELGIWGGPAKICKFPGGVYQSSNCGPNWEYVAVGINDL